MTNSSRQPLIRATAAGHPSAHTKTESPDRHLGASRYSRVGLTAGFASGSGAWCHGLVGPARQEFTERLGQWEVDVLFPYIGLHHRGAEVSLEVLDALADDVFRRRGTGGDQDVPHPLEPRITNLRHAVNEMCRDPQRIGDLGQSLAVGAVLAAKH